MIHNLLDEHQFLHKYPEKELHITAKLFGQLIQHQLVSFYSLVLALKYILGALKNPPPSKLFTFGLLALQQFNSRIYEWPSFCKQILAIPHLHTSHPEVIQFVENKLSAGSNRPPEAPGLSMTPPPISTPPPTEVQQASQQAGECLHRCRSRVVFLQPY